MLSFFRVSVNAQYVLITKQANAQFEILNGVESDFNIINVNCKSNENFLIHFIIFSDEKGKFNNRIVSKKEFTQNNSVPLNSIFIKAKENTRKDQQREITYFEFDESQQGALFIKTNKFKLAFENTDGTFTIYDNICNTFFYEIRDFKQFVAVQSCASLINTKSIFQKIPRLIVHGIEPEIEFPDSAEGDYFPNKLFLEKINFDSSFHFVRYRELCMDCGDNFSFEFDFNKQRGITRVWYYLPKSLSKKRRYIKFEK